MKPKVTSQQADDRLGKVAYDAYCMQTGGTSLRTGETLPSWEGQDSKYHDAWISVARAVEAYVQEQIRADV